MSVGEGGRPGASSRGGRTAGRWSHSTEVVLVTDTSGSINKISLHTFDEALNCGVGHRQQPDIGCIRGGVVVKAPFPMVKEGVGGGRETTSPPKPVA